MASATGLDGSVLRFSEQSGATILTFHPRPQPDRRAGEGETETSRAFAETSNRPSAVFRGIIWAVAIPIGMVLLFRAVFGLFLAL